MANYANLKAGIDSNVYENLQQRITGTALNSLLKDMVDSLGAGYQFMGIATPSTNPGTPDQKIFYLASQDGTYPNFGNIAIENEVAILSYDTTWHKLDAGIKKVAISQNALTSDLLVGGSKIAELANRGLISKLSSPSELEYDSSILTIEGFIRPDGTATGVVTTYHRSDFIQVKAGDVIKVDYASPSTAIATLAVYGSNDETDIVRVYVAESGYSKHIEHTMLADGYIRMSANNSYLVNFALKIQEETFGIPYTSLSESVQQMLDKANAAAPKNYVDAEIAKAKGIFKYLFVNDGLIIAIPSANKWLTIKIGTITTGNGLVDFRQFGTLENDEELAEANISQLHYSSSDWFAPFQIKAKANIDGDDTEGYTFTGGSHQYNNGLSGSTPTARLEYVKYYINGAQKESGGGLCNFVKVEWSNLIQASNTKKIDGSGREVLRENITLSFDGQKWKAHTELIPLEDITLHLWYGYQFTGIGSGLSEHWGFVNGSNRGIDENSAGNDKCIGVYAYSDTFKMDMLLNLYIDMADRSFCSAGLTTSAFKSDSKAYFTIANNDGTLNKDERYFLDAEYSFVLSVPVPPLVSGDFDFNNEQISGSFNIADLPNGEYRLIANWSGETTPPTITLYLTSGNKSGIISTYSNVSRNVEIVFTKTAETNYGWLFQGGISTGHGTYAVYAK